MRYHKVLFAVAFVAAAVVAVSLVTGQTDGQPAATSGEGSVTGRFLYSSGAPAALMPLILRGVAPPRVVHRGITDDQGTFQITGVEDGAYRLFELRVYLNAAEGTCEVLSRRSVEVTGGTLDLGDLVLTARTIPPSGG